MEVGSESYYRFLKNLSRAVRNISQRENDAKATIRETTGKREDAS